MPKITDRNKSKYTNTCQNVQEMVCKYKTKQNHKTKNPRKPELLLEFNSANSFWYLRRNSFKLFVDGTKWKLWFKSKQQKPILTGPLLWNQYCSIN